MINWLIDWLIAGKVAWLREEALASILSVEMVDLPLSETEAKIEDEFGSPDGEGSFASYHYRAKFKPQRTVTVQYYAN